MTRKKIRAKTITLRALRGKYGKRAEVVLSEFLVPTGLKATFYINGTLPSPEVYQRMESFAFSLPLAEQVETALVDLQTLYNELDEWFKSLSPGFQKADHGKLIEEARDDLEDALSLCPVPKEVAGLLVMYIPKNIRIDKAARDARRDDAVARIQACVDALKENGGGDDVIVALTQKIKNARKVKFPSMYF